MTIYIASSWRNQHAVEMVTDVLENRGHTVLSFVRAAVNREGRDSWKFDVDEWIASDDGATKFGFDTSSAMSANLVVYIGPSGTDAWAEVGAAWAKGVPIYGLRAKGERAGLMRRMVRWFDDYRELLTAIQERS